MRLIVERDGRGPPLVLLHGWALHSGAWGAGALGVRAALAERSSLHLIDLPGHGRNAGIDPAPDLDGIAAQVLEVAPARAAWLGWSLGGLVALACALAEPARVARLVLTAATPRFVQGEGWSAAQSEASVARFEQRIHADREGVVRDFLALQVLGDERAQATLHALRDRVLAGTAPSEVALANGLAVLRRSDLRHRAAALSMPLLGVSGARDRLTPPAALEWLCAAVPDGRHLAIPKAAHAPFLSHPERFVEAVAGFLAQAEAA